MFRGALFAFLFVCLFTSSPASAIPLDSIKSNLDPADSYYEINCYYVAQDFNNNGQYDSAIYYYKLALNSYMRKRYTVGMASVYNNLGIVYYRTGKLDSSNIYYHYAGNYFDQIGDTNNLALTELNRGINYKELGDYENAIRVLLSALRRLELAGDERSLSSCYNTLANVYRLNEELTNSTRYHRKALLIRRSMQKPDKIAESLNNIALNFLALNEIDSASAYLNEALNLKGSDNVNIASTLNNLALTYIECQQYDLAKQYLERVLQLRQLGTDPVGRAKSFNNLGKVYTGLGLYDMSLIYLDSATAIIDAIGLIEDKKDNLELALVVYDSLGLETQALITLKKLMKVKDQLLNIDKIKSIAELQTKYETDKKEQSIANLKTERELQDATIRLNEMWITMLLVTVLLVFVIGLITYRKFRSENKSKRKIEVLMQELHHRVKNNLQLLSSIFSLQSRVITDSGALETVRSGENRINAMAIIHQKLYKKAESRTMEVSDYLISLINQLAESYGYSHMLEESIEISIQPVEMDVDKVIPMGLVVNELVSNAFKYAFDKHKPCWLQIKVRHDHEYFTLTVADNGPGFKHDRELRSSMGLNIIETLCRQLRATTSWKITDGVTFELTMAFK